MADRASRDANFVPTLIGVSSVDGTTATLVYVDPVTHRILVSLTGGGSVAGSDTQVQFNDGSAFGADSGLTYNKTTHVLTATNLVLTNALPVAQGGTASTTASGARTALGLAIGTDVQAYDPDLTAWAGKTAPSGVAVGDTDSQTLTNKSLTSPAIATATLTGVQILAENASIGLDPAGSADGKYTGITVTATAGYTQAFGDCVYLDPTDSRWELCDANSAAGADGDSRGIVGMVVVAGTDGTACTILLNGIIRADAKFPSFTINNPIYISETAGAVTQTQPTTTDVVIRIIGAALTADEMFFRPDWTYTTHT